MPTWNDIKFLTISQDRGWKPTVNPLKTRGPCVAQGMARSTITLRQITIINYFLCTKKIPLSRNYVSNPRAFWSVHNQHSKFWIILVNIDCLVLFSSIKNPRSSIYYKNKTGFRASLSETRWIMQDRDVLYLV